MSEYSYFFSLIKFTFILICFIISVIAALCYFKSPDAESYILNNSKSVTHIPLEYVMKEVDNGDIIFFSGTTFGEKTCKWFIGSIFSHIGFLFREKHPVTQEDIVYIFECDLGQISKDGVRIMSLKDKLSRYPGLRIGAIKKLIVSGYKERPKLYDILGLVKKYENVKFDNKIITWWVSNYSKIYNTFKNSETMFCSELVSVVYQDLGILKKNKPAAWYNPEDFHLNKLEFEDGYSLGETKFFNFPKSEVPKS